MNGLGNQNGIRYSETATLRTLYELPTLPSFEARDDQGYDVWIVVDKSPTFRLTQPVFS